MSVYGKKIVIDGVEYVAVPEKKNGWICEGCAFCIDDIATCKASGDNANLFKKAFGKTTCSVSDKMILKKVTPKKKPVKIKLAKVEATRGTTSGFISGKIYNRALSHEEINRLFTRESLRGTIPTEPFRKENIVPVGPKTYIKEADKFIVCLLESDGLKPADVPKQHYSEADAIKEAERLCKKHNQKFVVLKVVAEVSPMICPVTTKRG